MLYLFDRIQESQVKFSSILMRQLCILNLKKILYDIIGIFIQKSIKLRPDISHCFLFNDRLENYHSQKFCSFVIYFCRFLILRIIVIT